jgi:hypothetical protein
LNAASSLHAVESAEITMKPVSLSFVAAYLVLGSAHAAERPGGATEAFPALSFQLPVEIIELPTIPP